MVMPPASSAVISTPASRSAGVEKLLVHAVLAKSQAGVVRRMMLVLARMAAGYVARAVAVEAVGAHGFKRARSGFVVADDRHAYGAVLGPVRFERVVDGVHGVLVRHAVNVCGRQNGGTVVVERLGARNAVDAVDAQLKRGVYVDRHVRGREKRPRRAARAKSHEHQAGGQCGKNPRAPEGEAGTPTSGCCCGRRGAWAGNPLKGGLCTGRRIKSLRGTSLSAGIVCRRRGNGLARLLLRALLLDHGERALRKPRGHMLGVKGLAHALLYVGRHDRASLSFFLPREIHEYTVPSGMPVILEISGAVYPSYSAR